MRLKLNLRRRLATTAGALAITVAGTAHASNLIATYTGVVSDFTDSAGLFGSAGAVLDGQAFVARFTYDPSLGQIEPYKMDGGPYWGLPEMMSATLSINGHDWNFGGYESRIVVLADHLAHYTSGTTGALGFDLAPNSPPADYFSTLPLTYGAISSYAYLLADSTYIPIDLTAESVQISAPVPEPQLWGLMILGFGLAGAGLRRRGALVRA